MKRWRNFWALGVLGCALSGAWAQDSSMPSASDATPQMGQQPPQDTTLPPVSDNPPLSGLDLPSLEPHAAPLSYIQPGATISESADSNVAGDPGNGSVHSVTRGLGSITLERQWSHYDLALDYVGGAAYYNADELGFKTLQQMDFDQKITWKRGQLSLRDSFSYLPEGTFGGAYGSLGSQGIQSLGTTAFGSFWGGSSLGSLGLAPRILNVALADVSENLTPQSTLTAAGGYAFTHFYGEDVSSGTTFIGSSQFSAQIGYNRLLSAHTQIALVYGYQGFDFSVFGTAFHSHVIQGVYGHRISGRMDLLVGAGPQFTIISGSNVGVPVNKIGVAAQGRLRYRFPKTGLDLKYERFETSGSGFFAGAQSDIASFNVTRPLSRVWTGLADIGYSKNSRLQSGTGSEGVNASTYEYGFAGAALQRAFGRNWHGFVGYQFNELEFDRSYCGANAVCNRIGNRHVGTIGLDWTPRPIRID
jgi:hypothetical protein